MSCIVMVGFWAVRLPFLVFFVFLFQANPIDLLLLFLSNTQQVLDALNLSILLWIGIIMDDGLFFCGNSRYAYLTAARIDEKSPT